MPAEENKQIVREFIEEVLNRQRVDLIGELLAPDYALHFPGMPEPLKREAFPVFIASFPAAFPDFRLAVESLIAEGDEVAVRFVLSGTHQGEFMGIAPPARRSKCPATSSTASEAARSWMIGLYSTGRSCSSSWGDARTVSSSG